ncbi:porin family protein [Fulvivirga ligni]|uniref:porin family protein n=1 Tax=Fulvivirga ligni TaxID=2904246 RepID=UPI001F3B89BC|nr:porin family protein [Fulvivirga ligni]UII21184.1 PorT family protein [Fulvivirga ligni]
MKQKTIILLAIGILGSFCCNAQIRDSDVQVLDSDNYPNYKEKRRNYDNPIYLGVKAGMNISNTYNTDGDNFETDSKLGVAAGFYALIPVGDFFGIQPEILLSQKGFNATGQLLDMPYVIKRTTTYIDIPILFAFRPISVLSIMAGLQYSYLLIEKNSFDNAQTSMEQEQEFENDKSRKSTICVVIGPDVNFYRMVISGRLGWDLRKNNGYESLITPTYKNYWGQIMVGYRF